MYLITRLLVLVVCAGLLPAMVIPEKKAPNQVASAYFEALTQGDADALEGLYAAPYSCDGERLAAVDDVRAMHAKVIGFKGKRPVPTYEAGPATDAAKLDAALYGQTTAICITITAGDHRGETVVIYVTEADGRTAVVGFRD